jgi:hypothetical protein
MKSNYYIIILILLCFWLYHNHRNKKHQDSYSITSATNEKVFYSDSGLFINQGSQSISITNQSIIYSVQNTPQFLVSPIGIGIGTDSPSSLLQVDGTGNIGIGLAPSSYIGITGRNEQNPSSPNSQFTGMFFGESGYISFYTRNILLSSERARMDSSGRLLIGTTTASINSVLTVNGSIIQQYIIHISLYNPQLIKLLPTEIKNTFIGSTYIKNSIVNLYQYCIFNSNNKINFNPTLVSSPYGGNRSTGISIPYSGLYFIRFTCESPQSGTTELFISKNMAYPITYYKRSGAYTNLMRARYIVLTNTSPIMCWSDVSVYGTTDRTKINFSRVFQNGLVSSQTIPNQQLVDTNLYSFAYVSQAYLSPRILIDLGADTDISKIVLSNTTNPNDPPLGNFNVGTTLSLYNSLSDCYAPGEWFQYSFTPGIKITDYSVAFINSIGVKCFSLLGSFDNTTWKTLDIQTNPTLNNNALTTFTFTNNSYYNYYRLVISQLTNGTGFQILSFLLKESSSYVPTSTMTSNSQSITYKTINYTVSLSSSCDSSILSNTVSGATYLAGEWFQYQINPGFVIKSFSLSSVYGVNLSKIQLLVSNNGVTWSSLAYTPNTLTSTLNTMNNYTVTNTTSYTYYRLVITEITTSTQQLSIGCWTLFDASNNKYPSTNLNPMNQNEISSTVKYQQTIGSFIYTLSSSVTFPLSAITPTEKPFPYMYSYPSCLSILTYNNASVFSTTQNGYLITAPYVLYYNKLYSGPVYSILHSTYNSTSNTAYTIPPLYMLTNQTVTPSTPLSCVSLPYQIIVNYKGTTQVYDSSFFYYGTTITSNLTNIFTTAAFPDKNGITTFTSFNRTNLTVYPSYTIMLGDISTTNTTSNFGDLSPDNESLSNENLLASGSLVSKQTGNASSMTLSTTSYLTAGDYINFGIYSTAQEPTITSRTSASITLLQRNA